MVSLIVYGLLLSMPQLVLSWATAPYSYISYSTVTGFFLQDDPATNPSGFDYLTVNFGLINRTYPTDNTTRCSGGTQWRRFARYVQTLNRDAPDGVTYKVLFMGRHGEGYHNAAETYYGTPAWNCYWSELEGNGTVAWADATLTPSGVSQALKANDFWRSRLAEEGMPAPQSYYTSPMTRCLTTANLTFSGLNVPANRPFVPTVKEFLREGVSIHTCDRRSSRGYIEGLFPGWKFEPDFAEADPLWHGKLGESSSAQRARSKIMLDEIFTEDAATWMSITSHSGEITSLLSVLGHRAFRLSTGQVIPVLVKGERLYQAYPSQTVDAWEGLATCTSPPVTSLVDVGCVCQTQGVMSASATATATATVTGSP